MEVMAIPGPAQPGAAKGQAFQDLIASRDPAQRAVRFRGSHSPRKSQNLFRVWRLRGPDPLVPIGRDPPAPIGLAGPSVLKRCLRGALEVP